MQDAGEGAGRVAFEGELAVLSGRALWAQPLEQHAGHPVPVAGPDGVSLQRDVGGCLEEGNTSQFVPKQHFAAQHDIKALF